MLYQVVEKSDMDTDWAIVRYFDRAMVRFDSADDATDEAVKYITDRNCNNALTADEKRANIECFMSTEDGIFLGILDGKPWYMTYPKDVYDRKIKDESCNPLRYAKGSNIKDEKWFELESKTQVAIRPIPGT